MEPTSCCHHGGNNHHVSCIRLVPIFNHLKDEQMDQIGESVKSMNLDKGELLFRAGEKDDTLYIVNRGKVRIYRLAENGKEQLVRILNPGDFTGEWTIFNPGEVHENYAEALSNTSVCLIKQEDLQSFLAEYPQISLKILAEMSARLRNSEKQTMQVATEKVESRIISFLADCVEDSNSNSPIITLPMAKKDLASYLGTTPETISRKFTELEKQGLIEQLPKKQIKIRDLDQLLLYAE